MMPLSHCTIDLCAFLRAGSSHKSHGVLKLGASIGAEIDSTGRQGRVGRGGALRRCRKPCRLLAALAGSGFPFAGHRSRFAGLPGRDGRHPASGAVPEILGHSPDPRRSAAGFRLGGGGRRYPPGQGSVGWGRGGPAPCADRHRGLRRQFSGGGQAARVGSASARRSPADPGLRPVPQGASYPASEAPSAQALGPRGRNPSSLMRLAPMRPESIQAPRDRPARHFSS